LSLNRGGPPCVGSLFVGRFIVKPLSENVMIPARAMPEARDETRLHLQTGLLLLSVDPMVTDVAVLDHGAPLSMYLQLVRSVADMLVTPVEL